MLKITKYSIPVVLAGLVLAGRADDDANAASQPASGAPANSQQGTEFRTEAAQEQQKQQRQQQEQQRQQQQRAQEEQQMQAAEQQKNRQSIFQPGQLSDQQLKREVTDVNKASSFIGMAVKNTNNEDLGKINDLVFDPEKGKVSYAVLSVGGILGVGDKLIAVPVTSLKPQPGLKHLVLNMQKSQIESAPGLAQNNWPNLDAPGIGGAAGSESGSSTDGPQPKASSTSPSSSPGSTESTSNSTSTSNDPSSKSSGSSPTSSSGSNSDASSQSDSSSDESSSTPSNSSDSSATQGETKGSDQ